MVWSPSEYHLEVIEREPEFWRELEPRLEQFYLTVLLPEILDPRAPRGLPPRVPDPNLQVRTSVQLPECQIYIPIKYFDGLTLCFWTGGERSLDEDMTGGLS